MYYSDLRYLPVVSESLKKVFVHSKKLTKIIDIKLKVYKCYYNIISFDIKILLTTYFLQEVIFLSKAPLLLIQW